MSLFQNVASKSCSFSQPSLACLRYSSRHAYPGPPNAEPLLPPPLEPPLPPAREPPLLLSCLPFDVLGAVSQYLTRSEVVALRASCTSLRLGVDHATVGGNWISAQQRMFGVCHCCRRIVPSNTACAGCPLMFCGPCQEAGTMGGRCTVCLSWFCHDRCRHSVLSCVACGKCACADDCHDVVGMAWADGECWCGTCWTQMEEVYSPFD